LGIAAIRVALSYGLEVFTTVSTEAKKKYLLDQFPGLDEKNIGNSRDCSFESLVKRRTNGVGVNYVLNSLAEAKMQATVRCLAENGVFLEVGKFDMLMENKISLAIFLQGIEFKAVLINTKTLNQKPHVKAFLTETINKDIKLGVIKPLKTTVFPAEDIEKAFRYIATAKHIGKILIQIRDGESMLPVKAKKTTYFDSEKSYVITGGLGGMVSIFYIFFLLLKIQLSPTCSC
jgi:fatty acid synthase